MRLRVPRLGPVASLSLVAAAAPLATGCASQAILSSDHLPVRRVIVYRNGVAYFERGGRVDTGEVRFKMKQTEVGDFLATLAVMEKGGSSVRAAAFPLDAPDDDTTSEPSVEGADATAAPHPDLTPTQKEAAADKKKGLRTVVLSLDGKEHDLEVGYVAASPVWRPSYRLVVHPGGSADLQAWGIVQNLSGEDWKGVHLTLVAGAPLAFETDLGTPLIPTRPTVTDNGEVVAVVPHGETSLAQGAPPPPPPPAPAPAAPEPDRDADGIPDALDKYPDEEDAPRKKAPKGAAHAVGGLRGTGYGGGGIAGRGPRRLEGATAPAASPAVVARPAPPPAEIVPSGPRNLSSLAAVAAEGGATKYAVPNEVDVPDKNATMVLLISRAVPGETLFLYSPDSGVGEAAVHPFRVARFANKSDGALEKGPIAVFEDGSFLGQGVVDPLPLGATATVPFALERSVAIDVDHKWDELGERIAKIENGNLTIERDQVRQTKYRIRNGGDKPAKLLIKHPRQSGARLVSPPKDTEDNVGTGSALIPDVVQPNATAELVVDERTPVRTQIDWFSTLATTAFASFADDPTVKGDAALLTKLNAAWKIRGDIVQKNDELTKVRASEGSLLESAEETRRNLRAIEKNKVADALRATLTQRLTETSTKIDVLTKQKVELESKLAELKIRFKEALRDVKYLRPVTTQP
jgi:hypothetical protein